MGNSFTVHIVNAIDGSFMWNQKNVSASTPEAALHEVIDMAAFMESVMLLCWVENEKTQRVQRIDISLL